MALRQLGQVRGWDRWELAPPSQCGAGPLAVGLDAIFMSALRRMIRPPQRWCADAIQWAQRATCKARTRQAQGIRRLSLFLALSA